MDSAYSLPGPAVLMKNSSSFFTAKINVFYNAAPCRARRHARRRGLRHLLPYRELLLVLPPGRPKIIIFQRAKSIHLSIEEWLHLNVTNALRRFLLLLPDLLSDAPPPQG